MLEAAAARAGLIRYIDDDLFRARRKRFRDDPPLVRVTPPSPVTNATANLDAPEASTIWSTIYANRCHQQVRIFRTMPLAARWGKDTAYEPGVAQAIESHLRFAKLAARKTV